VRRVDVEDVEEADAVVLADDVVAVPPVDSVFAASAAGAASAGAAAGSAAATAAVAGAAAVVTGMADERLGSGDAIGAGWGVIIRYAAAPPPPTRRTRTNSAPAPSTRSATTPIRAFFITASAGAYVRPERLRRASPGIHRAAPSNRSANGEPLARLRHPPTSRTDGKPGRVVETVGRRVRVRDAEGDRTCFLSGHRVVIGDRVTWTEAPGEGGKITGVGERSTVLARMDPRGDEQVLAANLAGLLVVVAAQDPPFHAPLVDRYLVAASVAGMEAAIVVNKIDLGVPEEVEAELAVREGLGIDVLRLSVPANDGVDALRTWLAAHADGPWALVGYSGVGKTSLIQALLPGQDVGPIGAISDYWGTGRHTTTHSRVFGLPGGGEIVDSPGIRGFLPSIGRPELMREHFPGIAGIPCRYRDCLHRVGEDGCVAETSVPATLLASWRGLLDEAESAARRRGP
jgi:ribosome biogenesis GTPase